MKHLGFLVSIASLLVVTLENEHVHTHSETTPRTCHKLNDIIDEDNLALFDQLVQCEAEKHPTCQQTLASYECKKYLHGLFFNANFSAIDYAYAKEKVNLMRFLIQNINFLSKDDPDFINQFVFSKFFKAQLFVYVADELQYHSSNMNPDTQTFNLLF